MTFKPIKPARIAPKIDIRSDTLVPREDLRDHRITTFTNSNPFLGTRDNNIGDLYRGDNPGALLPSDTNPAGADLLTKVADDYVKAIQPPTTHQDIAAVVKNATDLIAQAMEMKSHVTAIHLISSGLATVTPPATLAAPAAMIVSGLNVIRKQRIIGAPEIKLSGTDDANPSDATHYLTYIRNPDIRRIAEISEGGINRPEDFREFMGIIVTLQKKIEAGELEAEELLPANPKADEEDKVDTLIWLAQSLDFLAGIARQFDKQEIPLNISSSIEVSSTTRTITEFRNRQTMPAKEKGVTLKRGASLFTAVHEAMHALSGDSIFSLLTPYFTTQHIKSALRWPGFPSESATMGQMFTQLAGALFRDEAYAGLAEIRLGFFFEAAGIPLPMKTMRLLRKWQNQSLRGYVHAGDYLGDNHLIEYNLQTALELTQEILEDPSLIDLDGGRFTVSTLPHALRTGARNLDSMALQIRMGAIIKDLLHFLAELHHNNTTDHPLKPLVTRLVPLSKTFFGIDLAALRRPQVKEIFAGERTVPRPEGSRNWIVERPDAAREAALILSNYAEIAAVNLAQLIKAGDFVALATIAMMIPDADLTQFWASVLGQVEWFQEITSGSGEVDGILSSPLLSDLREQIRNRLNLAAADLPLDEKWIDRTLSGLSKGFDLYDPEDGSSYPLLAPLVLQGYHGHARRLLPTMQNDALFADKWILSLFNGLNAISKLGDESAVDFWIEIIEDEARSDWARRYNEAIQKVTSNNGELTDDGQKKLSDYLGAQESVIEPREFYDYLFELVEQGSYVPELSDDQNLSDIEDSFDLEDAWDGTSGIDFERDSFYKQLPRLEYLEQLTQAVHRLRQRGLVTQTERLETAGTNTLKTIIELRTREVMRRIQRRYEQKPKGFRRADSFMTHLRKLFIRESDVLPPASVIAGELMIIINLSSKIGGGWDSALDYLNGLPDSFIKTFACKRLSTEMNHLIQPTKQQLARFLDIWEKSFEAAASTMSNRSIVQPDEEGLFLGQKKVHFLQVEAINRQGSLGDGAAIRMFTQKQLAAMFLSIPADAGGELAVLRDKLTDQLRQDKIMAPLSAPEFIPTLFDPTQDVENVLLKRTFRNTEVYAVYQDPNIIPIQIEVERITARYNEKEFMRIVQLVEEAAESSIPSKQADYIPLFMSLSALAAEMNNGMASNLYKKAYNIAQQTRKVSRKLFKRGFVYDGLDDDQKKFDIEARYRMFQATWERTALISLARLAINSGEEQAAHYIEEIRRIVDNESIFDVMESGDYSEAARILDQDGAYGFMVYDLYHRAIQTRIREQFEANYSVDHELAVRIDAAKLPIEKRDELLEQLALITFQRIFHASLSGLAGEHTRDAYLSEIDRLFQPFNLLLNMAESRGYIKTETALWKGLRHMTEGMMERLQSPMHPFALAHPVMLILTRHPELVHSNHGRDVIELGKNGDQRRKLRRMAVSPYSEESEPAYPQLPSAWQIRKASADEDAEKLEKYLADIVSEVPNDGSPINRYLLDLLNVHFMECLPINLQLSHYVVTSSTSNRFLFKGWFPTFFIHMGIGTTADVFRFAASQPDAFRHIFLSHMNSDAASTMSDLLIDIITHPDPPVEVKADAFRALEATGEISDYLSARFEAASRSPERLEEFFNNTKKIWGDVGGERFKNSLHLPDWFIAPLFEPILRDERSAVLNAINTGPIVGNDFALTDTDDKPINMFENPTVYNLLLTIWAEPADMMIRRWEADQPYFLRRLVDIADDIADHCDDHGEDLSDLIDDVVTTYLRNRILVRIGSVKIPRALERIDPRLRFVVADYISLVPPSTRTLLLGSLQRSEEKLGEDEVLRIFFELTGQEKLAQFLSLQEGVVPETYRNKLVRFQEDLKPSTHQEIVDTLRMNGIAVNGHLKDGNRLVFEHAGTVGELWQGERLDGRRVAIKILPWKKRRRNEESLRALEKLAEDLQMFRHEMFGGIDFEDLYDRYHDTLLAEMDYRMEAKNLEALSPMMERHGITYPNIHQDLLRRDAMFMDYIDFVNIADIENGAERIKLIDTTGRWLAEGIFVDGVFYEDFHPGNIKWIPGEDGESGKPLALDFGRIGRLTTGQRSALMNFLVAVTSKDAEGTVKGLMAMSASPGSAKTAFRRDVAGVFRKMNGGRSSKTIQNLFAVAASHSVKIHPNYLQFIKAVVSWEGVMRQIDPNVDFSTYAAPVIMRKMMEDE